MPMPVKLKKKVKVILPNPWRILFNVVDKYKKGQIKLSVIIKRPANGVWKRVLPRKLPVTIKHAVQAMPKKEQ